MKNSKLESIEKRFNLADNLVEELGSLVDDISADNFIPMVYEEAGELSEIRPNESILNLNQLKMDFQIVRQQILKVVNSGNRILEEVSVLDIADLKASQIQALAQLQTALGQNISLLLTSYKDIAAIEKSRQPTTPKGTPKEVPNVNGDLNQTINVFSGSSADLLKLIHGDGKVVDVSEIPIP